MNLMQEIKRLLPDADIYCGDESGNGQALMLRRGTEDLLAVSGALRENFSGEDMDSVRLCPLTHENRLALNCAFPYTVPVALGKDAATFGFGDRLGYANPMQLKSLEGTKFMPVLAQQSMRELSLMKRTYSSVIDTAAWAAFRMGWKKGFAADGDHLKTLEEIQGALENLLQHHRD